jgi:hypothetical protein
MMSIPVCVGEPANASFLFKAAVQIQGLKAARVVAEATDEGGSIVDDDASISELQLNMSSRASG